MPTTKLAPVAQLRTTEPEVIRASIRGIRISAMQFGPTATASELTRIPMRRLQLDLVQLASAYEFEGVTGRDNATIVFILAAPGRGKSFNFSTDTGPGYMGFWPTEGPLHSVTPAGYRNASLTLPLDRLVRELETRDVRLPKAFLKNGGAATVNARTVLSMERLVAEIRDLVATSDDALVDPRWRLNLERVVGTAFSDALAEGTRSLSPQPNLCFQKSEMCFRRARDYAADHVGEPIYLDDLCRACGLSRRGLQQIFREKTGVSPMEYLLLRRLNGARQEIKAGLGWGGIKAAALNWGFWHLGRFSAEYQRVFGELPRVTLENRRG